jgi:hypothetical protein
MSVKLNHFTDKKNLQCFSNGLLSVSSSPAVWCFWGVLMHALVMYSFCTSGEARCKMPFKTGPQMSQWWDFWVDGPAFGVIKCDTSSRQTPCIDASLSLTRCPQPKIREITMYTLVGAEPSLKTENVQKIIKFWGVLGWTQELYHGRCALYHQCTYHTP